MLTTAALLFLASPALRLGPIELKRMVSMSELIAVVKVTTIEKDGWSRFATATIERTIHGKPKGSEVTFLASPIWTCDTADAKIGERIVLFAQRLKQSGPPVTIERILNEELRRIAKDRTDLYVIAASGRGRIPIETQGKREGFSYGNGTFKSSAFLLGPQEWKHRSPKWVDLATFNDYVVKALAKR